MPRCVWLLAFPLHNVRDGVPTHHSAYDIKWKAAFRSLDHLAETAKDQLQANYDRHSRRLQPLIPGTTVWIQHNVTKRWVMPGLIVESLPKAEYLIRKASGRILRRNRVFLRERKLYLAAPGGVLAPQPPVQAPPAAPPPEQRQQAEPPAAAPPPPEDRGQPEPAPRPQPAPALWTSSRVPKKSTRYPADKYITGGIGRGKKK